MLDFQEILYWFGTMIGLIFFVILSIKFVKQIKNNSSKFEKYQAIVCWLFVAIVFFAIIPNSLVIICSGTIIDIGLISYSYQKEDEIDNNKRCELRFHEERLQ